MGLDKLLLIHFTTPAEIMTLVFVLVGGSQQTQQIRKRGAAPMPARGDSFCRRRKVRFKTQGAIAIHAVTMKQLVVAVL